MLQEDPFETFKAAFVVQRSEIQNLFDRVSELERANTEVLSYVREHGSLPVLACRNTNNGGNNAHSVQFDTEIKQEFFNSSTACDNSLKTLSSNERALSTKIYPQPKIHEECLQNLLNDMTTGDPSTVSSSLLSDLITQHAAELNKALENLGLEPEKRNQLLDQVQLSLHSILHTQLTRDIVSEASPAKVAQPYLTHSSRLEQTTDAFTPLVSSGDGTTPGGWPLSSLDALAFDKSVDSVSHSQRDHVAHVSSTPLDALSLTTTDVHEKRRLELMRLNQRIQNLNAMSPTACGTVTNVPTELGSGSSARYDAPFFQSRNMCSIGSTQCNNDLEPAPVVDAQFRGFNVSTTESFQSASSLGLSVHNTAPPENRLCPCGSQQHCPLTLVKQRRFASDPRVARGFTLLAAAFRGRLIRQLLATPKVYDLIRTVKDTAKLALSIHVERQASSHNLSDSSESRLTAPNGSLNQGTNSLSAEELVLESRLMVQLRGALSQLHDIFFSWPLTNQLELLALSRSLPQRTKRISNRGHNIRDGSLSAEPPGDVCSQRSGIDLRRRWCSSTTAQYKSRDNNDGQGSCGSYSLTKSIEAVRQSWPQSQQLEKRKKLLFPLSGLTALAHEPQKAQCELFCPSVPISSRAKTYLKGHKPATSQNQIQAIVRNGRPQQVEQDTAKDMPPDQSPPVTLLDYTPVKLHIPPTPNTLETMNNSLMTATLPLPSTGTPRPPVVRSSRYNMRQMCQNLRVKRQLLAGLEPTIDMHVHLNNSQHRPIQLQRRGALLFRRTGNMTRLASTSATRLGKALTQTSKIGVCAAPMSGFQRLALSQPPLAQFPHLAGKNGQRNQRSLSTLNLREWRACDASWKTRRSTSALAKFPAHVPYWKEVLWQWRNQRHG